MPEQPTDYRVAVFGSGGVGKTSLVLRFVRGTFRETYIPTIEDTYRQVISCNRQVCTLQITDTTGSHQFPAMQRLSITKAHAFILVYSITNKASFEELQPLYTELTLIKMDELSKVPIMLVGNKIDENDNREVSQAHGRALAQKWKCGFMETSAKSNFNVKEVFQELLKMETRRNMTLVGDIKTRSRFTSFFKRRPNEVQSTNTIGIVNSSTTTTTSLIDALDMPKHINTIQEQPIATTSKDKKIPLKLKKFLSIKTNSDTTDTVKNDINGDFPQT
ncbi:GTP-binding protein isoform 2 [Schistosoma japonicum]|uniref:GTP-binding protein isoform 2 n=2 Tax=Schistosoma japonicum TaxID=6182 RepID=A0A4Z2DUU3_SCHJA|nr:GTP-binding protein isoform 2 [Schistosoma japonicum]TNN20323.1 GTP-binding protein isoform 2 [Schistosoma japonicum]